jgi:hypothetical protein
MREVKVWRMFVKGWLLSDELRVCELGRGLGRSVGPNGEHAHREEHVFDLVL